MPKIILHLDFNSFFASAEQQANPFLRGKPIAVAGKGKHSIDVAQAHRAKTRFKINQANYQRTVVTTASIEAKRRGVKTAMSSIEAKRICPELIIIPGDPHKYSQITSRFLTILERYADAVEQFSTDEAFADITMAAGDYFGATMLAQRIRSDIQREIGRFCTASIGIAPNKLVAKLACESKKPNGLTVVMPEHVQAFVVSQELQAVCGIGPRIERRLHTLGITSMRILYETPLHTLVGEFKSYGYFLYFAARGVGDDEVTNEEVPPNSVGHSYTFPHDLRTPKEIKKNLLALCDKVAWRMRRDKFISTRLSVYVRYGDLGGAGTEKQYKEPMEDGLDLFKNAWQLIERVRNPNHGVRLLGVSASGLAQGEAPRSLFLKPEKIHKALKSLDALQTRYGSGIWQRAATLGTVFKERTSGWHYDHEVQRSK